jgi:HTH-type transcriptional regulator/antitoxin HigA
MRLEPYLGSRSQVSEVLDRNRPLSLDMIRKLQNGLGISTEVLILSYELQPVS